MEKLLKDEEFIPYGTEWATEMMKWNKPLLVGKIRELLNERTQLKEGLEDLKSRYNDLLLLNND
jgi:hypothetical protein